jgi:hypothetical protein
MPKHNRKLEVGSVAGLGPELLPSQSALRLRVLLKVFKQR